MNNQEVFNKVATHLFTQGKRAYSTAAGCVYRGPGGTSCAVGCLIPDELYDPNLEGDVDIMAKMAPKKLRDLLGLGDEDRIDFLADLQSVHDYADNWSSTNEMRSKLSLVAKRRELDSAILETLSFGDGR